MGDEKQLPATILNHDARENGLGVSLFEQGPLTLFSASVSRHEATGSGWRGVTRRDEHEIISLLPQAMALCSWMNSSGCIPPSLSHPSTRFGLWRANMYSFFYIFGDLQALSKMRVEYKTVA